MKYAYSRNWSVMSSKDELCPHCGNTGYIKYYYLGLDNKVKNWFKTKSMCRKNTGLDRLQAGLSKRNSGMDRDG